VRSFRGFRILALILGLCCFPHFSNAQSSEQAQMRGTVSDSSGAVIPGARVTLTDTGTNVTQKAVSNEHGLYVFTALTASNYRMLIDAPGFGTVEKPGIVLAVNQQTTLNVTLLPAGTNTSVTVESVPVLLDSDNATLGTDIGEKYLTQIPLENRDPFGLVFLAAGVTESAGSGINDSYPAGTNFVSNGQRNSTAEIRLDGTLTTAPEQGEGGTSNIYYQATVEALQEVKVQNNSFSSEYGNNGGTVIDEVMKSGTNRLHGSAYEFNQDSIFDARDYFNSGPKPGHSQNQFGFSIGGPIIKNKTFFFGDFERVVSSNPVNIVATVPTAAQVNGDFSAAMTYDQNGNPVQNQIFDPFQIDPVAYARPAYPNNTIPSAEIDPVGQAILKLYPAPNTAGDSVSGANNYRKVILAASTQSQFDVKIDQHFSDKSTLSGRYSNVFANSSTPTVFGDGEFNDGTNYSERVFNDGIIYSYTPTVHTLWTITAGLDRVSAPGHTNYPSPTSVGFPSYLEQNGIVRMPAIIMPESPWTSIFDQCCVDTHFAHTLANYSSAFSWTKGSQTLKFGGEQRLFYNNFFQPNYPNGYFSFDQDVTAQIPFDTDNGIQGNSFAGLLLGYGDSGSINVTQAVADKSKETGFYVQDDWRATKKLTVNLGIRYEWSTPYSERHNNSQFSDFTGGSGLAVPGISGNLLGTTVFASSKQRTVPTDWNNVAPRLGFAYLVNDKLAVRGGAGVYYGMSVATNFQYPGTAYTSSPSVFFTKDGYLTRSATLENPFPTGIEAPQGTKYGKLAEWGLNNGNNLDTGTARNAEVYQWNLGIQQAFPANIVLSINYSANHSTHLPWGGYSSTNNRNFIASSIRRQYNSEDLGYVGCPLPDGLPCNFPNNPFQPLFSGPNAIFNEPESRYGDPQLPLLNLLRPYPQFDGTYSGLARLIAQSWYNALEVVFQKRAGKYINLEGNYTWSKNTDNSSTGFNAFVGTLNNGNPQELDNLGAEWSVSANDATNRFVLGAVLTLPIGRGTLVGANMNRALNALVGGWQVTTLTTFQTGQPLDIAMSNNRIADGNQRPNVTCAANQSLTTGLSIHKSAEFGNPYINANCFSDPGDQQAGSAPRYFSNLRSDGIHNTDVSLERIYNLGDRAGHLEIHGECLNCANTERFGLPDYGYGDSTFGIISSTAGGALPRNFQLGARYEF
jgi:hypothetical protein